MKSVLHIQLVEDQQQLPYQTEVHQLMREKFPGINFFELDNHSDPGMISYALEMIRRSTQVLTIVESKSAGTHPAKLIRLFNRIHREKSDHLHLILLGEQPVIEKMMKPLGEKFIPKGDMQHLTTTITKLFA